MVGLWLLIGLTCVASAQTVVWKPEKAVELIAPAAAGGGSDRTARLIQRIWQEKRTFDVPVAVVNKTGGAGAVALTYLRSHASDPHFLQIVSAVLLTNHIIGTSTFHYAEFTPVALLNSEYVTLAVRADSPLRTLKDLMARLRADPAGASIAVGTSIGGVNHATAALVARAAGAEARRLRAVAFKSSAESMVAVLGGHVDVAASSASLLLPHLKAGTLRLLAVASPRRLAGALAEAPTLKEQGIDAVVDNFRLMIAPPGVQPAQLAFWDDAMARLARDDDWRKDLETNQWENTYMNSRDTRRYLDQQYAELKIELAAAGLVK